MLDCGKGLVQEVPVGGAEGHVGLDSAPQHVQLLLHAVAVLHQSQVRTQAFPLLVHVPLLLVLRLNRHGVGDGGLLDVKAAEEVQAILGGTDGPCAARRLRKRRGVLIINCVFSRT